MISAQIGSETTGNHFEYANRALQTFRRTFRTGELDFDTGQVSQGNHSLWMIRA